MTSCCCVWNNYHASERRYECQLSESKTRSTRWWKMNLAHARDVFRVLFNLRKDVRYKGWHSIVVIILHARAREMIFSTEIKKALLAYPSTSIFQCFACLLETKSQLWMLRADNESFIEQGTYLPNSHWRTKKCNQYGIWPIERCGKINSVRRKKNFYHPWKIEQIIKNKIWRNLYINACQNFLNNWNVNT